MVDKEMLAAISDLMDQKLEEKLEEKLDQKLDEKLKPVYDRLDKLDENLGSVCGRLDKLESDMKFVRVVQLENGIIRRLNTIEKSYLDTSERYMEKTDQDTMEQNIGVLKSVVQNHSERLNQLSV